MFLKEYYKKYIDVSNRRVVVFLFFISLLIRLVFFIPVHISEVPAIADEANYYLIAEGYQKCMLDTLNGVFPPSRDHLARAYWGAFRPPLLPLIMSFGFMVFGDHVSVARLMMILFSAMTTSLVFIVSIRLVSGKAAIAASIIHMIYPSFIAYSHYLWTETLYIFLQLLAVYFSIMLVDSRENKRRIHYAILVGVFLALTALARPAILPIMVIIPVWVFIRLKEIRPKIYIPCVIVLSTIITLFPYEAVVISYEKRFVFVNTHTNYNLYQGNNPWVPDGFGSFYENRKASVMMTKTMNEYAEENSVHLEVAAGRLAMAEIKRDPGKFIKRSFYQFMMLWSIDYYMIRHFFRVAYPPVSNPTLTAVIVLMGFSYISLIALSVLGFFTASDQFRKRNFIAMLVVLGMAPIPLTITVSRFHLPFLALFLPAAGHGAVNIKTKTSLINRFIAIFLILSFTLIAFVTLPSVLSVHLRPSSYYSPLIRKADDLLGSRTIFIDNIKFRTVDGNPESLRIALLSDGYAFSLKGRKQRQITVPSDKNRDRAWIYSHNPEKPLEILLFSEKQGQSAIIKPIKKNKWRIWRPSGIKNVEYIWAG